MRIEAATDMVVLCLCQHGAAASDVHHKKCALPPRFKIRTTAMLPFVGWRLLFAGALHIAPSQPRPGRRLSKLSCRKMPGGCGGKAALAAASASPTVHQHLRAASASASASASAAASPTVEARKPRRKTGRLRQDSSRPRPKGHATKGANDQRRRRPKGVRKRFDYRRKGQGDAGIAARPRSKAGRTEARGRLSNQTTGTNRSCVLPHCGRKEAPRSRPAFDTARRWFDAALRPANCSSARIAYLPPWSAGIMSSIWVYTSFVMLAVEHGYTVVPIGEWKFARGLSPPTHEYYTSSR